MPQMIEEPGLYELEAEDYHADPCPAPSLNNTTIGVLLDKCPRAAWHQHPRLNDKFERKESKRFDLANVAHELMLGKGRGFHVIDADAYTSSKAKAERDAARAIGRTPILVAQYDEARAMVTAAREQLPDHEGGENAFNPKVGTSELGLFWQDQVGPWGRSLIDFYANKLPIVEVWDYKTTDGSAKPAGLGSNFVNYGYETQCAIQERGLLTLFPDLAGRIKFRWLFQETEPPYLISTDSLDDVGLTIGRKMVSAAFLIWDRCLKTNTWPGYPKTTSMVKYPAFAEAQWVARELEDELLVSDGFDPFLLNARWQPNESKVVQDTTLHPVVPAKEKILKGPGKRGYERNMKPKKPPKPLPDGTNPIGGG